MIRVVIYTPPTDSDTWLDKLAAKLDDLDLSLHSATRDYATASRLVDQGDADAIFVARHDHVPHGPRVIVAAEVDEDPHGVATVPLQDRFIPPRQRRPRPLSG